MIDRLARSQGALLAARAAALAEPGRRYLLGIAGGPAAGKSTLAADLAQALGPQTAVVVPLDGFHLAQSVLAERQLTAVKGALETFDLAGFLHLLRRLRGPTDEVVYAPTFRRELEEPIAGAIAVPPAVPLVIVEGNYLLVEDAGWGQVRPLLDQVWFLAPPEDLRTDRLIARHRSFGRDEASARARAAGSDQANADIIGPSGKRADVLITGG